MSEYKLSFKESVALYVNLFCSKLLLSTPLDLTERLGQGAVISIIFSFAVTILFFLLYTKNTNKDFISLIKNPFLKKGIATLLVVILIFCATTTLSLLTYYVKKLAYPSSPLAFLTIPFAVCMLYPAYFGLKSIAKLNGFFVPIIFVSLSLLVFLSFAEFDFTLLAPIFSKGAKSIIQSVFFMLSSLFELVLLLLAPKITKASFKKVGITSLLISCALYVLVIASFILLGTKASPLPVFTIIHSGFFSRADILFIIAYAISGMLYLATLLYFSSHILSCVFAPYLKQKFVFPLGLIIISLSSISFFSEMGQSFLNLVSKVLWIIPFVLPLFFIFKKENKQ